METFSALLAICAGNSPVPGEFPAQRPVTWSFHVFFDLRPNKRLSKQWWGWWFETLSRPLWRHRNELPVNSNQRFQWFNLYRYIKREAEISKFIIVMRRDVRFNSNTTSECLAVILQVKDKFSHLHLKRFQMHDTGPHWLKVNIRSGKEKPLPEPMTIRLCDAIEHHQGRGRWHSRSKHRG